MESLKIIILLGLAATASAAVCTNTIAVDYGRGQFWACTDIGSGCITAFIRYPGIATNPSITFCEGQNTDGSKCHTASSNNICSDIPLLTILMIPTPDLTGTLQLRAGFRSSSPPKVCFNGPEDECGATRTLPEEPSEVPSGPLSLTDEDRKAVVDRHNSVRKGVVPSAANMKKMEYNMTLEKFAQDYLNSLSRCPLQHNPGNSDYGENVYLRKITGNVFYGVDYAHVVQMWYDEVSYYNFWFNRCSAPKDISCGHFTQVVWANTERVGCGVKKCEENMNDVDVTYTLVVCNYDPPGNVRPYGRSTVGRPYTSGRSCSSCPSTHSSCQSKLCVKSSGVEQVKQQMVEDLLRILLGNSDKPEAGVQEWEMGANEEEEKAGEFVVSDDGGPGAGDTEFKVTQKDVQEETG